MVVAHSLKVDMLHGIFWGHSLSMVISEHLAQQVEGFVTDELVVLGINKLGPGFAGDRLLGEKVLIMRIQGQSVLVQISIKFLSTQDLSDFH